MNSSTFGLDLREETTTTTAKRRQKRTRFRLAIQNFARASPFFVHFFVVVARPRRLKLPYFACFETQMQLLRIQLQKNSPTFYNCKRHGIRAINVKTARIQFLRVCLHGGGGPQVGEVTRLGGVTHLSI